jgi:hypothetical protein
MFGPKKGEMTGKWKASQFVLFTKTVKGIKSRNVRWETHIVRVIEERNT